jgi:hypothetical protein
MEKKFKIAILVPGTTGLYYGIYQAAKKASRGRAFVTSRFQRVEIEVKSGSLSKVIIIEGSMGRKKSDPFISAPLVRDILKRINRKIKYVIMDSWPWKGAILLTGRDTVQAISSQI